jgi:hypothetical protein
VVVHLFTLHEYVSSSSVGVANGYLFSNWFMKDLVSLVVALGVCLVMVMISPCLFMDADN